MPRTTTVPNVQSDNKIDSDGAKTTWLLCQSNLEIIWHTLQLITVSSSNWDADR